MQRRWVLFKKGMNKKMVEPLILPKYKRGKKLVEIKIHFWGKVNFRELSNNQYSFFFGYVSVLSFYILFHTLSGKAYIV